MKIDDIISNIEKKYGKGSVISFDEGTVDIITTPSGILTLDIALGGGYPQGRIVEIFGEESTGKTTLAIHAAIEVQRQGRVVVYIDFENAFDPVYAESLGLQLTKDKFLFVQPCSGEEGFDIGEDFLLADNIGIIIIDSVSAMVPKAELEGDFGDSKMGLHARLMSQGMRKLVSKINKSKATVIFINQLRDQIGVMFGDPKVTTGGNALKFYASQRIRLYSAGSKKEGEVVVATTVRAKIIKNKIAAPFREARFDICFGEGVDNLQCILDLAVQEAIVKKSGSWYSYMETKLGQGEVAAKSILRDNPELLDEITLKVKKNCGLID